MKRSLLKRKASTSKREERVGRKLTAQRSGSRCEVCLRARATDVHHRKNRSQGGTWDAANLMHLCHLCHGVITNNPRVAITQGWTVPSHRDPADVPVWLGDHGWTFLSADGSVEQADGEDLWEVS